MKSLVLQIVLMALAMTAPMLLTAENSAEPFDVKEHYDKIEVMIPMRDGVKLFTAIYTPKNRTQRYPILLYRTPYSIGAYGEDYVAPAKLAPSLEMLAEGYIFVSQDLRGTYKSEGQFEVLRVNRQKGSDVTLTDESTDAYDTIDWLLENLDDHNGRVGQWGVSYAGWTTVQGMIDAHPALKASSPQASPSDMFIGDDWHHNGAFRLTYAFAWMNYAAQERSKPTQAQPEPFDYGTPWGYEFFLNAGPTSDLNKKFFGGGVPGWEDFIEHPNYDEYWQRRNVLQYLDNIEHPVLNVAGWFDAEDFYGPVSIYQEIERRNPVNQSTFVSGPWKHGAWHRERGSSLGDIQFGSEYDVSIVREDRVAGRKAVLIAIRPHDEYRYGHRLWLDVATGFPLQTRLMGQDGEAIEQVKFADIQLNADIHSNALAPSISTDSFRWFTQPKREIRHDVSSTWSSDDMPPGFRLVSTHEETLASRDTAVTHILYSDGLASVSVFIEPTGENKIAQRSRVGSSNSYSVEYDGYQVTAIGEVPSSTVEKIATSMRPN